MRDLILKNFDIGYEVAGPVDRYVQSCKNNKNDNYVIAYRLCVHCKKVGGMRVTATLQEVPKYICIAFKRTIHCWKRISEPLKRSNRPLVLQRYMCNDINIPIVSHLSHIRETTHTIKFEWDLTHPFSVIYLAVG